MKYPSKLNTYCPTCRKQTAHKAKLYSKGKARTMAWGQLKHARKLKGYVGKVAGEKTVKKQGKRQKVVLECSVCKKKHERTIGTRTRKKLEITG
jgi:large subunit ribosomal protein L44e